MTQKQYAEVTRVCTICEGYVGSNTDSVLTCGDCGNHFHLCCFEPPLQKKPSRGYSWQCMKCMKEYPQAESISGDLSESPEIESEQEIKESEETEEDPEADYEAEIRDFGTNLHSNEKIILAVLSPLIFWPFFIFFLSSGFRQAGANRSGVAFQIPGDLLERERRRETSFALVFLIGSLLTLFFASQTSMMTKRSFPMPRVGWGGPIR